MVKLVLFFGGWGGQTSFIFRRVGWLNYFYF